MDIPLSIPLRIAVLLALTVFAWPVNNGEEIISKSIVHESVEEIETVKVETPVAVIPSVDIELKKIAWCESKNRQFNEDGSVRRGVINAQDIGKYQINEHYHLEDSKALGMDIYTLAGNTAYAQYLHKTQGNTPWNWSKDCWSDPNRVWWEKDGEYWSE